MITPDPKYFVIKNANGGTRMLLERAAVIGSSAPISSISNEAGMA